MASFRRRTWCRFREPRSAISDLGAGGAPLGQGIVSGEPSSRTREKRSSLLFLDALGKFWVLPYTCMGVLIGAPFLVTGSRCEIAHNAIVFHRFPLVKRAFALGNVILSPYTDLDRMVMTYECAARARRRLPLPAVRTVHLGKHEEAHTWQYQLLGPLFLPVYLLTLLLPAPTPFERAADNYAHRGEGWWPWRLTTPFGRSR